MASMQYISSMACREARIISLSASFSQYSLCSLTTAYLRYECK